MLGAKVSAAIFVIMSSSVLWSGRATLESKGFDRETIAGHKVLRIHESARADSGWRDLAVPFVLFQDPRGIYWVGTVTTVHSFDEGTGRWTSLTHESGKSLGFARTIAWSADGKLWVQSLHYLSVFDGDRWHRVEAVNGFKVEPSVRLLRSNSGRIWLVQKSGVYSYDKSRWLGPITPPGRTERLFNLYSDEKKGLDWMASRKQAGIMRFVLVGIEDRDGDLWMATRSAVLRFSPSNRRWAIYRLPTRLVGVLEVYEDSLGRIWFSDSKGSIAVVNKADGSWSVYDIPESLRRHRLHFPYMEVPVNAICQDKSGQILFATDIGLISLREGRDEWNVHTIDNSALPDNEVSTLLVDTEGKVWMGTGKGVVVLEP